MKKLTGIYSLFFLLLCTSCIKEIKAPGANDAPKPIVGFILRPGQYPKARLGVSNMKFNNPDYGKYNEAVRQAQILLYKNGTYFTTLRYDSASFFYHLDSTVTVEANAAYTFSITMPSVNLSASGPEVTVPGTVTPTQISFNTAQTQQWLELTLPKDLSNRYLLLHISIVEEDTASSYPAREFGPVPFTSDGDWIGISQPNQTDYNYSNVDVFYYNEYVDTLLNDSVNASYYPTVFAFDAAEAAGSEVKIKIKFRVNTYDNISSYTKLHLQTVSVNKDYYEYVKSAKKYEQAGENPFSTPVQVYSNISNGYGIFGAAAKTVVWIDL